MNQQTESGDPIVSIVIPAYNHQEHVKEAIESALQQSWREIEVIIIDDASSDNTWDVITSLADPRINATRNQTNLGAHATLNLAIGRSRGKYISILNSDDRYHTSRIEQLVSVAEQNNSCVFFAFSNTEFIYSQATPGIAEERIRLHRQLLEYCDTLAPEAWFLAGNPAIGTSNFFFSRTLFDRVGPFQALRYTHDWDWAARSLEYTRPVWLKEPLVYYRIHSGNTLAEDDYWRHIHENSYIQSRAIQQSGESGNNNDLENSSRTCQHLLHNDSLHPLSLLCFLIARLQGVSDNDLLQQCSPSADHAWWLEKLAKENQILGTLFRSLNTLFEQANTIETLKKLARERWNAMQNMENMITHRNQTIETQKELLVERLQAIHNMDAMIKERDQRLGAKAEEYQTLQTRHDKLFQDYTTLNSSRAIRLARFLGRLIPGRKRAG